MTYPSIFNDVLGPVMRGPSSSHCAAALRIGRLCRDLMDGEIKKVLIEYDPNGSLATTHKGQGSDMGLLGGFLGWEAHDERLPNYETEIAKNGMDIHIHIHDIGATHPNTYQLTLSNDKETRKLSANSVGGGMIEVINIDGAAVEMIGDYHETLIYVTAPAKVESYVKSSLTFDHIIIQKGDLTFIQIKSQEKIDSVFVDELLQMEEVQAVKQLHPVLPILSYKNLVVPFITCEEMLAYATEHKLELWELALRYESQRGNISEEQVFEKMRDLVNIMRDSINSGLAGTSYKDRILGSQSQNFKKKLQEKKLLGDSILNQIVLSVSAMMEVKSSMGVIVAAPTAGACGALPGALIGAAGAQGSTDEELIKAMLCSGMIGVFIAAHASFAAEVGGCQAECGSGSCMAAAGLVHLGGGNLSQAVSAASQALQNSLGMICDPIANRVEAPCLGKNVMAASNALSCANMALSDYDHLIPLDQVIKTMADVSAQMAHELRCTMLGGLSVTDASKEIEAKLNGGKLPAYHEELAMASRKFKIC